VEADDGGMIVIFLSALSALSTVGPSSPEIEESQLPKGVWLYFRAKLWMNPLFEKPG
jgi:hypothetical protein